MEFHVQVSGALPDVDALGDAVREIDPSALLDVDASGAVLRVAAALRSSELIEVFAAAGYPVAPSQVRQLPSICCGGCSG